MMEPHDQLTFVVDLLPTVTALIRGPFGRHAWVMQLRHSPRIKRGSSKSHLSDPGRPLPVENVGTHHSVKPRNFPESVDKVTATKGEKYSDSGVIGNG